MIHNNMTMMGVWAGGSFTAATQIGKELSNPRPTPLIFFPENYVPFNKQDVSNF